MVDFSKLSAVQFAPRGIIRLNFKYSADKERLVTQGSIILENIECDVTPSDRPNTMVYVHHYPAEGDDALLLEEFRRYGKIVSVKHQYFAGRPNPLTGSRVLTMSLSQQIPAEVFVDSYPTRGIAEWHRFVRSAKPWATKPRIVNITGNAECGDAGHLARACPSRRGGRVWGDGPILANFAPLADAQSFPPIVAPPVSAEADVPEVTEPINSMDAEDSHVSSGGSPSVPEVDVVPGPLGVSLLAAVEGMDGIESENESVVDNVTVVNSESKTESSSSMDIANEATVVKDIVVNEKGINVVKVNEINVETSDLGSQESGSMECSGSPSISSFSSSSDPPDSLDQLLAAGRKHSNRAIIPSAAVAATSIVKRSKAVPGAGVQKKKGK